MHRVYGDRLVNETDSSRFDEMVGRISRNFFEDIDDDELQKLPLTFTTFAIDTQGDTKVYFSIDTYEKLKRSLSAKLLEYNEANARMDLVLFEQAMEHVCRISRIIDNPHRGNALLVGVGGSGKQSLTRLAAFISGFSVFQVKLTSTYSMADFRADLFTLYSRAGLRGEGLVFLLTDQHVVHERMLVYFNDMLSSGTLPDLYTSEDKDNVVNAIRNEVKAAGVMDSSENCWDYFIDKVQPQWLSTEPNLHFGALHLTPCSLLITHRCAPTYTWCCACRRWATPSACAAACSPRSRPARPSTGSTRGRRPR